MPTRSFQICPRTCDLFPKRPPGRMTPLKSLGSTLGQVDSTLGQVDSTLGQCGSRRGIPARRWADLGSHPGPGEPDRLPGLSLRQLHGLKIYALEDSFTSSLKPNALDGGPGKNPSALSRVALWPVARRRGASSTYLCA